MDGTERTQKHWFAPLEISPFCIILSIVEFLTGFADTAILVMLLIAGPGWAESQLEFRIDVLFLDADKEGYIDYLNKLLPLVRPGGLIIAHNMRRPSPDPRYIEAITKNPQLDTSFLLMDGAGIAVTLKKRK